MATWDEDGPSGGGEGTERRRAGYVCPALLERERVEGAEVAREEEGTEGEAAVEGK